MKAYTNEAAYRTYRNAAQAVLDNKELVKALYKLAKIAATEARNNCVGTFEEKLAAIKAATAPFTARIAEVEAQIEADVKIADENFDAWEGLK